MISRAEQDREWRRALIRARKENMPTVRKKTDSIWRERLRPKHQSLKAIGTSKRPITLGKGFGQ